MEKEDYIQVEFMIKKLRARNQLVRGIIVIDDGQAFAAYSDKNTAERIFEADKKSGLDVRFVSDMNAVVEQFPGKNKNEILEIVREQMKKQGAKEVENKKV